MLDVKKIREDFPILKNNPGVYLDNAATTYKPQCMIDAVMRYYTNLSVNVHRGDYEAAYQLSKEYDEAREEVANFIGAKAKEIVFTSGASESLNLVAYGYGRKY
ncbi:MAG: aminotransferase class V-fold PLP-dependent enzyme, partial [Anaerorhabdus sp.]